MVDNIMMKKLADKHVINKLNLPDYIEPCNNPVRRRPLPRPQHIPHIGDVKVWGALITNNNCLGTLADAAEVIHIYVLNHKFTNFS